ncbi:DUF4140 domain-containing protein, partial [Myxococcota bacterium]|nr:DUF4140 domain-containing protein [Myxococcota bacterium]
MEVKAQINAVQIYAEGAEVRRRVTLSGAALGAEITISDLPLSLEDHSARARVLQTTGPGRLRVGALRVGLGLPPEARAPIQAPTDAIREAARAVELIEEELTWLEREIEALRALPVHARPQLMGRAPAPSPLEARMAFDAFAEATIEGHTA